MLFRSGLLALSAILGSTLSAQQADGPPLPVTFEGAYFKQAPAQGAPSVRAEDPEDRGNLYNINMVVVVGDRTEVTSLPNWDHYENEALYQPMSEADIEVFRQRVLKDLQDRGFIFATVSVYKPSLVQGFLKLRVHVGELGQVTVRGNRHRTAEQILRQLDWNTGSEFNYNTLFQNLYGMNTNPGFQVQSQLRPRQENGGRRVIDAEFTVKEGRPFTIGLTVSNDGSLESNEWRTRASFQLYNPLKLDDTIGVEWMTSPANIDEVNAVTGSYVLNINDNYRLTFYGGFSKTDLSDVLPHLDLVGKGYFVGAGLHRNLWQNSRRSIDASVGWLFLNTRNRTTLGDPLLGLQQYDDRVIDLSMPRATVSWTDKVYDSMRGRNFFSYSIMLNFEGALGASNSADYGTQVGYYNNGNYIVHRFQAARFQKLLGEPEDIGSFSLFTRFDAQVSTSNLPTSLRKTVGGASSVRGYFENEAAGDSGYEFSLEFRTPLIANFIKGLQKDEEFLKENPQWWGVHRLQAVAFFDMGTAAVAHRELVGQEKSVTIFSVGAGLRMMMTRYAQFKLDYGYPLKNTTDSPSNGRVHFSGQMQF